MDTSTVSVYHHTSRQEEQQLQVQNQFINELYPMATGGNPALSPSPVLHSGLDNSMGSSYTTSPLVGLQQAPASVPSQIHHMGMGSPFGSHNNLPSSTPMTSSIPTQQHFGGLALDGVAIDSTACVLYSPNAALGHPHHHNGGVPSNTPRMSLFGDQALGVPTGPSYPSNMSSLDIPFAYSQPRDGLGGVLFDTHALGNFQSQGMFGDLSSYSSPNSSQQLGMMPPTPISAPFANHHNATVNVAAAIATAQSVADTTGPLGLSLQAPTSLFNHHHQHYSPVPLGTVNSAPPDMLEFPHDVLRTQCSVNERQISTSPYYGPSAAHTPAPSAASNSSKVNIARRSRMHHGTTEHRYRRKSELMATELIAGAVGGAASVEGSNLGSTANSNSAGVGGGARCVSSTLPENPFYRYEHVFSINDKAEQQQQQQPPPPLRRQAVSSHAHLSMPLGFAAARGGSVSATPFLAAPGFKAKVGAKRVPGAATPLRMSACENALGLVGGNNNNGAGQVTTVDTPALSLQCSEDEDGNGSRKVSHSFIAGIHSQNNDFVSFLSSQNAAANGQSCGSSAMFSFNTSATATSDCGSIGADPTSSSVNPADIVKSESSSSSKKRGRKDSDRTSKRCKSAAAKEGAFVKREHNGECSEIKCTHPDCEKSFTRRYNLKSHERTHTDERPFPCDLCEQRFSRNHDLKRHKKIHTGARPFMCTHCNRGFARADALSRHTSKGVTCKRTSGVTSKVRRANAAAMTSALLEDIKPDLLAMSSSSPSPTIMAHGDLVELNLRVN